mmetsp:Transcript_30414/g.73915  ORF Transcript_30414/g.73915 Transcript_30414/m.73915 type:complete len:82 (+) Transcript_30414:423-668(+)
MKEGQNHRPLRERKNATSINPSLQPWDSVRFEKVGTDEWRRTLSCQNGKTDTTYFVHQRRSEVSSIDWDITILHNHLNDDE